MSLKPVPAPLSPAEIALHEGMSNIILVTIGENLQRYTRIVCNKTAIEEGGATLYDVTATVAYPATGRQMVCRARIPVSSPDAENRGTRISNRFFQVKIDDYLELAQFDAWCECNPYNGAMTVVRMVRENIPDRWLVGGGNDEEVLYRGEFDRMPKWAKAIALSTLNSMS